MRRRMIKTTNTIRDIVLDEQFHTFTMEAITARVITREKYICSEKDKSYCVPLLTVLSFIFLQSPLASISQ